MQPECERLPADGKERWMSEKAGLLAGAESHDLGAVEQANAETHAHVVGIMTVAVNGSKHTITTSTHHVSCDDGDGGHAQTRASIPAGAGGCAEASIQEDGTGGVQLMKTADLPQGQAKTKRDLTVDMWRGIIMMVMALDHVNVSMLARYFVVGMGESWLRAYDPVVPGPMTWLGALTFIIRSVVSFPVMPGFAFLMGVGIQLLTHARTRQKWSVLAIWRFFLMRGICLALPCNALVVALFMLVREKFVFDNTILFALGINMIITSTVILLARSSAFGARVNLDAILALLLAPFCILYTQIFVYTAPRDFSPSLLSVIFLLPGHVAGGHFGNSDVVLPFLGVTLLGAAFGRWHTLGLARSSGAHSTLLRWLVPLLLSLFLLTAFVALRLSDAWGNTYPFGDQVEAGVPRWVSFFSLTKYPPSLAYLAYALGVNLGIYAMIVMYDIFSARGLRKEGWVMTVILVYAASALAFYILHFYFVFLVAALFRLAFSNSPLAPELISVFAFGFEYPALLWSMYQVCKRWSAFKATTKPESLWRLL